MLDFLNSIDNETWIELASTITIGIITLVFISLRTWLFIKIPKAIYDTARKHWVHPNCPSAAHISSDRVIYEHLTELRTLIKADRARVYQFHNGISFSSKSPLWRVSCTHESCKAGVSHELAHSQNILASSIWEILEPLFNCREENTTSSSITRCTNCPKVTGRGECQKQPLYWVEVDKMDESFTRGYFASQGVSCVALTPLISNGNLIGFVTASYIDKSNIPPDIELVRKYASTICYILKENF